MTQYVLAAANWLDFRGIVDFFRNINKSLEHSRKVNSTIKELSKLTDRELNDIGIARGDIWSIAHEDSSFRRYAYDPNRAELNKNLQGWV